MNDCIIHNVHGSNFGNLMIKYVCAMKLKARAPHCVLSNYNMPYWGINHPPIEKNSGAIIDFTHDQKLNIDRAAYLANSGLVDRINLHGHYQRMETLLSRPEVNDLFKLPSLKGVSFSDEFVVCPLRGAEILGAIHSGYGLIPVRFYQDVIAETGLRPVFIGQTDPNPYTDALRQAFPDVLFLASLGASMDFETIRHSKNIILPISTFAWLGAWLSEANKIIMPLLGLYNPEQFPEHDFIPLGDKRYEFYKFPIHHAVPVEDVSKAHKELDRHWHRLEAMSLLRS